MLKICFVSAILLILVVIFLLIWNSVNHKGDLISIIAAILCVISIILMVTVYRVSPQSIEPFMSQFDTQTGVDTGADTETVSGTEIPQQ